jgi:phosphate:Na+ symporter
VLQAAGGLGLFLLGMSVMTGGLKLLADDRLQAALARTTRGPVSGACTGAFATALLQSSSATTVAAVGFVHAGLMTFSQALTVIFGANIGTTITGWLVALVGFKLQLDEVVLPLILVGVLLRLTGRSRMVATGTALAGFGLIFVGIEVLQSGMEAFRGVVTPESFPPDTLAGRLLLVLIGTVVTVVTQSSSAGVTAALTAVHAETISLNQACAMVIGMDFGTTVTAAMATIGGNVQARRTGMAHVVYNAMTAVGAFVLLVPFLSLVDVVLPDTRHTEPELVLVGFHSTFNTIGVIAVLPFTRNFAALIVRMFPQRGNPLTRRLDPTLLRTPAVALDAVALSLRVVTQSVFRELTRRLKDMESEPDPQRLTSATEAVEETREYLQSLKIKPGDATCFDQYLCCVHILDHLRRAIVRVANETRLGHARADADLSAMADHLLAAVDLLLEAETPLTPELVEQLHQSNAEIKRALQNYRRRTMQAVASGELASQSALRRMDTARWIRRLVQHLRRIAVHSMKPMLASTHLAAAFGSNTQPEDEAHRKQV